MHRIIKGRDEKGNLAIPYPRPNERRYLGETGPSRFTSLKILLLHLQKGETRASLRFTQPNPRKIQYISTL